MLALDFSILADHLDMYLEGFVGTIRISLLTLVVVFLVRNISGCFTNCPIEAIKLDWHGICGVCP